MWRFSVARQRYCLLMLLAVLLLLLACEQKTSPPRESDTIRPGSAQLDACTLLAKEEIEAAQGSRVIEAKSSSKAEVFRTAQCYYSTAEANQSVSLVVTQSLGAGHRSPKDFWSETFGRYDKESEGEEKEEEEREERAHSRLEKGEKEREAELKPTKIEGLGDSAYWTGDRFGGALYVLKKDTYLRISVGGRDSDERKISKSKALAEKALSRF